ncbi:hypothetical protein MTR67_027052 [Solanum verrucosum]|uniref:SWIM-type domain-containing protein n=1 Tax=Solanum verrucosum TaxID=315347 RepID=A0AAF0TUI7_SOLVR|nr:hypothetical protein MTR67_027052 [Solanum verrucosum]
MDHIIAVFHHGGSFYKGQYVSKLDNIIFIVDKDHFSLTEMKSYAKDVGASHPEDGINGTLNEKAGDDNEEENSDSLDFEEEDLDGVPDEDDSEVDEELRAFRENLRQEKRNEATKSKERIKKSSKNQDVELGETGIYKGFEDIFKNKAAKYIGRLGGNEEFIGSSDELSEDSDEELDVLAQPGVDLPSRRKSKKLRAKMNVINKFLGDWKLEFSKLLDYADMIKSTNPRTSCWVRTDNETVPRKYLFKYLYVCFGALKNGWLRGCRKIIGLDGGFFKGACKGELLVVVGKNGNQQMYPIAWAVVDQETKHSCSWFLSYLIQDLQLGDGNGITIMSDMQKGLDLVVDGLLPNVERRMCARHKTVISMLEDIRHKMMDSHGDVIKFVDTWISDISPMARLTLEINKEIGRKLKVNWNHDTGFEILEGEYRHIVNMANKTCSCRLWQLKGIPCQHLVCALHHIGQEP